MEAFRQNAKTFRRRQPWTKFSGPWGAGLWQGVGTWVAHEVAAGWLVALGSRPWSHHLEAYFLQSRLSSDSPDWWKIPVVEFEVSFSKRECKLPLQMRLGCPAVLFDSSKLKVRPWITAECLRIQAWHPSIGTQLVIPWFPCLVWKDLKRYEKMKKSQWQYGSVQRQTQVCQPFAFFRIHSGLACNQFAWQRDSTQMLTWKLPIAAPCDDVLGSAVRCSWTTISMTISVRTQVHAPLGRPSPCVEMCQISPWKIEIFKKSNMIASYNTKNF